MQASEAKGLTHKYLEDTLDVERVVSINSLIKSTASKGLYQLYIDAGVNYEQIYHYYTNLGYSVVRMMTPTPHLLLKWC